MAQPRGGPGEPGKPGGLFGGGQNAGFSVGKTDNLNPEAQDCYFYYYSTCTKVGLWTAKFLFVNLVLKQPIFSLFWLNLTPTFSFALLV